MSADPNPVPARDAPGPAGAPRLASLLRGDDFRAGRAAAFAGMPGMATWGFITGLAMVKAGLTVPQALGMTFIVYSGTAQLATLGLVVAEAPLWLIMVTALLVSLRFFIYGAALSPDFGRLPVPARLFLGYVTTDAGLVGYQRVRDDASGLPARLGRFLGSNLSTWLIWQVASVAGILAAGLLSKAMPRSDGLAFLATMAMSALLLPLLDTRAARVCAVAASVVAIALQALPFKLGLFVAVLAGPAVALLAEPRR